MLADEYGTASSTASSSTPKCPSTAWSSTAEPSSPRRERRRRSTLTLSHSNQSTHRSTFATTSFTLKLS